MQKGLKNFDEWNQFNISNKSGSNSKVISQNNNHDTNSYAKNDNYQSNNNYIHPYPFHAQQYYSPGKTPNIKPMNMATSLAPTLTAPLASTPLSHDIIQNLMGISMPILTPTCIPGSSSSTTANTINSTKMMMMINNRPNVMNKLKHIYIDNLLMIIDYFIKNFNQELKLISMNLDQLKQFHGPQSISTGSILDKKPNNPNIKVQYASGGGKDIKTNTTHTDDNSSYVNDYINAVKCIIEFDYYTLFNKKRNPNYQKIDLIIDRIKDMIAVLNDMHGQLTQQNPQRLLIFFNEFECVKLLEKIFSKELLQKIYCRKICSEIWKFIQDNHYHHNHEDFKINSNQHNKLLQSSKDNHDHLSDESYLSNLNNHYQKLILFLYGISLPSPYIEDYPLHQAIFESNLPLIRKLISHEDHICFYCHIEESDPLGMTPLMLAVKLANKDAVLILVENGADPKHRTCPYARTALEEAVLIKHRSIIRTLIAGDWHLKKLSWEANKEQILNYLETIPDFTFDMSWECDSKIIPFTKKYIPSDRYKIYKRGSNIRIDMTLIGFAKMKCLRGNMSIILKGKEGNNSNSNNNQHQNNQHHDYHSNNAGRLLLIDNIENKVTDLLSDIDLVTLEQQVDDLLKQKIYDNEMKADDIDFQPAINWKGDKIYQKFENYSTTKYNAKGTFSLLCTKRNVLISVDITQFKSFQQYFDYAIKHSLYGEIIKQQQQQQHTGDKKHEEYSAKSMQAMLSNLMIIHNNKDLIKDEKSKQSTPNDKLLLDEDKKKLLEKIYPKDKKLYKYYKKSIVACVWLCENFPITFEHLLPILDILANVSSNIAKFKSFLQRKSLVKLKSFPIKAVIPIFFYLNAVIEFKNFNFSSPDVGIFEIDQLMTQNSSRLKHIRTDSEFNLKSEFYLEEIDNNDNYSNEHYNNVHDDRLKDIDLDKDRDKNRDKCKTTDKDKVKNRDKDKDIDKDMINNNNNNPGYTGKDMVNDRDIDKATERYIDKDEGNDNISKYKKTWEVLLKYTARGKADEDDDDNNNKKKHNGFIYAKYYTNGSISKRNKKQGSINNTHIEDSGYTNDHQQKSKKGFNSLNKDVLEEEYLLIGDGDYGENDDDSDCEDLDISEKSIYETLKLNNNQSTKPKTIASIMQKYTNTKYHHYAFEQHQQNYLNSQQNSYGHIQDHNHNDHIQQDNYSNHIQQNNYDNYVQQHHTSIQYHNNTQQYDQNHQQENHYNQHLLHNTHYTNLDNTYNSHIPHDSSSGSYDNTITTTTNYLDNNSTKNSHDYLNKIVNHEENKYNNDIENSTPHELNNSDHHMKKLMKYNLKKHTLLSKCNLHNLKP